jgi:acetoin utilization protein AcuB
MRATARPRRRRDAGPEDAATWIVAEPVRRWMRTPVTTIGAGTTVREAAALMRTGALHHLPVVDARGRLVGIVTDRDLRQVVFDAAVAARLPASAARLGDLPVRDVMTWGVVTVTPATDLRAAAALMRERRLGALPVVEGGRVVGMLTEHDLVGALVRVLRERVGHPTAVAAEPGGEYDLGFLPPDGVDPSRNAGVVD